MNDKSTMNKVMEYMALAKPIVQFDVTEGRVSAGEASLYAKPNDPIGFAEKIAELLDAPERCEAMGTAGHARVRDSLSWDASAPVLLAAYDRAFALRERRGSRRRRGSAQGGDVTTAAAGRRPTAQR
jgi:glycosyltransferase involved in cell wall biosynthesis